MLLLLRDEPQTSQGPSLKEGLVTLTGEIECVVEVGSRAC